MRRTIPLHPFYLLDFPFFCLSPLAMSHDGAGPLSEHQRPSPHDLEVLQGVPREPYLSPASTFHPAEQTPRDFPYLSRSREDRQHREDIVRPGVMEHVRPPFPTKLPLSDTRTVSHLPLPFFGLLLFCLSSAICPKSLLQKNDRSLYARHLAFQLVGGSQVARVGVFPPCCFPRPESQSFAFFPQPPQLTRVGIPPFF